MDRMKFLLLAAITSGVISISFPVQADESYIPSYSASPSGQYVRPTPQPTPTPVLMAVSPNATLVPGTCVIKTTRSSSLQAPDDVTFSVTSRAKGVPVTAFAFDFGDGSVATGSSAIVHRYLQAGTYTVTAEPIFSQTERINPCKITLTFKGVTAPTPTPSATVVPTATPAAALVTTQPETGPSSLYWGSLLTMCVVWLGAELWYRRYHL